MSRRLIAILAVLALPAAAHATRVVGFATGAIAEYAETDANGALVFGLDETQLLGEAVLIEFSYDTVLAPADSEPSPDTSYYESDDPALDWLDLSITVNGITHDLGGAQRRVHIFDGTPIAYGNDVFQLSIDHFYGEPEGGGPYEIYRREFLEFIELIPEDTLTGDALPTSFSTNQISPTSNSASFRINESDYDPISMTQTYSRYVAFTIDLQSITVATVPEPRTAALFACGLLALGAMRRRR